MRINETRSTSGANSTRKPGSAADGSAFRASLETAASVVPVPLAASTGNISSVAALMALQTVDDPLERRKRVERRGRQLLDALDALKIDLLDDKNPTDSLLRLKNLLETRREDSGDQELESLIDQVELRVEVELAKLSRLQSRA